MCIDLKYKFQFINAYHFKYIRYEFYQQKIYTLVLNHEVYNEVYNHQLFFILINLTCKLCYRRRQKLSRIFLRKCCSERFWKIHLSSSVVECNFCKVKCTFTKIALYRECILLFFEIFYISTLDPLLGLLLRVTVQCNVAKASKLFKKESFNKFRSSCELLIY